MKQIFFILSMMFLSSCVTAQEPQVCFAKQCVNVAIAKTEAQVRQGLSGHAPLEPDQGMLFVFDKEGIYTFWMHGMTFPLDIIWLDQHGKVVFVKENLPPCTLEACPKFTSTKMALYVLEVPAGYSKKHNVTLGKKARLP